MFPHGLLPQRLGSPFVGTMLELGRVPGQRLTHNVGPREGPYMHM